VNGDVVFPKKSGGERPSEDEIVGTPAGQTKKGSKERRALRSERASGFTWPEGGPLLTAQGFLGKAPSERFEGGGT